MKRTYMGKMDKPPRVKAHVLMIRTMKYLYLLNKIALSRYPKISILNDKKMSSKY